MITDRRGSVHSPEVLSWLPTQTPSNTPVGRAGASVSKPMVPSFGALYEEYLPFVWRTARRLGVPDANLDDAVQDVFLVVYDRLDSFEGRSSLRTWLFGIVRRVARDHRPRKDRVVEDDSRLSELPTEPEHSPSEQAERAESAKLLQQLLEELDDDKREAFVLAELEELTMPEVAEALGINVNTAGSRVRAARKELELALVRKRAQSAWRNACPK